MSTINGQDYQHALIDVTFGTPNAAGVRVVTFTALNYSVKAPKKPVMDSQGQIIRYTIDNQAIDGSITLLRSEWVPTRSSLLQQFGGQLGILQIQMDWNISYGNSIVSVQNDVLRGVMFQEDTFDSQNNQEALIVQLPLFIQSVQLSGQPAVVYRPY